MARSLESRLDDLEYTPAQTRPLTDAERAIRLHGLLIRGWTPPRWLQTLLAANAKDGKEAA